MFLGSLSSNFYRYSPLKKMGINYLIHYLIDVMTIMNDLILLNYKRFPKLQ